MRKWILGLLLVSAPLCAAIPDDQDIEVKVEKSGDVVEVDLLLRRNASRDEP